MSPVLSKDSLTHQRTTAHVSNHPRQSRVRSLHHGVLRNNRGQGLYPRTYGIRTWTQGAGISARKYQPAGVLR